jgi:heat-inducible transcriptional repressor
MFHQLSERQEMILGLVVRHYIELGGSAGSKTLVEQHQELGVSSATVRNEFVALTELGYLTQLHTSAGRVPTENGIRYFVQKLLGEFHLPIDERQMIRHQFHQARLDLDQWMRLAVAILARTSLGASFVTPPRPISNRLKHIQLISTQGRLVLMIVVLYGGEVKQQMLNLAEPVTQGQLSSVADRLNKLFADETVSEISAQMGQLDSLELDVALLVQEILSRTDSRSLNDFYRDGLMNIVEDDGTRQAVRVLEERTLLASVLSETKTDQHGVQVVIGGEGRWEELRDCSMILSRYGVMDEFSGTVAVIGPTRMAYGRNVAAVRYVADLMSGLVYEYYLENPELPQIQNDEEQN